MRSKGQLCKWYITITGDLIHVVLNPNVVDPPVYPTRNPDMSCISVKKILQKPHKIFLKKLKTYIFISVSQSTEI